MSIAFIDPPYLRHLGEMASLKSAIMSYFHQDAGHDHGSDDEIWKAMVADQTESERRLVGAQLRELLLRDDYFLLQFWNRHASYFWFETGAEVRDYLRQWLVLFP